MIDIIVAFAGAELAGRLRGREFQALALCRADLEGGRGLVIHWPGPYRLGGDEKIVYSVLCFLVAAFAVGGFIIIAFVVGSLFQRERTRGIGALIRGV